MNLIQGRKAREKKQQRIVGIVLLLLSVLCFTGFGYTYPPAREKEMTWAKAEGVVIRLIRDQRPKSAYYPLFRFEASDGQSYEVKGTVGSRPPGYECGERVPVLYPESAPAEAVIDSITSLYFIPLFLAAFGTIFFVAGAFLRYIGRRPVTLTP